MSDQVVLCPIGFGIALAVRKFFTSHKCDDQARSSAKLCMSDLRHLFPCHKANRNAATPFCNTGKINPICHRTTPQKVNHANSRCSAHTDAIFTKLVSMKHKYDNENDHSNDCRDHPRPSAKTGRKADDIAVCFIPPQNTHSSRHPAADHVVSTLYAAVCRLSNAPLQYLRTHGQHAKKHPFGCFFACSFRLTRRALRAWPRRPRPCRRRCRRCSS